MLGFAQSHPIITLISVLAFFTLVGRLVPWVRRPPNQESDE